MVFKAPKELSTAVTAEQFFSPNAASVPSERQGTSIDIPALVEIEQFLIGFPSFSDDFLPISTFSTVYKALDLNHTRFMNDSWHKDTNPEVAAKNHQELLELEKYATVPEQFSHLTTVLPSSTAIWRALFKKALNHYRDTGTQPVFVALKRINPTSSPDRILDEISFIAEIGHHENIVSIISVHRHEDQIVVVTPYFAHMDFRDYFQTMDLEQIRAYMKSLLSAVKRVHDCSIIHRDLKPSNFLYSIAEKRGLLVDFGLAQKYSPLTEPVKQIDDSTMVNNEYKALASSLKPGYLLNDKRPSFKASRAGTRGFRAPEVLFKCVNQTSLIDMWSVGVIFLTILVGHYPLFNSSDDFDAIVEIACIMGNDAMKDAARFYGREWKCTVPSVPDPRISFAKLVEHFNPALFKKLPLEIFDLLNRLLALKSSERISAAEALRHPFIAGESSSCTNMSL